MKPPQRQCKIVIAAIVALLLAGLGGCWWLCSRSDSIDFLPPGPGANWIIDSQPPENDVRPAAPSRTVFKRSFVLNALPDEATVSVRVFKSGTVMINNQEISGLKLDGKGWKLPVTASISKMLRRGTNEISVSVTNYLGPPALWLRLDAGPLSLGSDEQWLSSPTESHWLNAHRASIPPVLPPWSGLSEKMSLLQSIGGIWLELLFFVTFALAVIFSIRPWLKRSTALSQEKAIYFLLALVLVVRAAIWVHDVPKLAHPFGFDARDHEAYIRFIQDQGALPLPKDGWEMKQPPLYYLGGAVFLDIFGLFAGDDGAVLPLRALNGIIGLVNCWLALLCLRRIFPGNFFAQAVGLLAAAFLPANLYTSFYVSNDPLAGLFVTLAFYFFLRQLGSEKESLKLTIGLGAALGLAVLTKLTALLAVPVFFLAIGLRLLRQKSPPGHWLKSFGVAMLAFFITCGWHYVRVGGLPLHNTQSHSGADWWQEPGFRTMSYYFEFGHALESPLFSDWHSFADGIYSTLWADGLISGNSQLPGRPPWNYDLMNLASLVALTLTVLGAFGLFFFAGKFTRTMDPLAGLLAGTIVAFAAGLVLMTLSFPALGAAKAFYALPALVPFSACIAAGSSWVFSKKGAAQAAVGFIILVWALMAIGSFWIRSGNFEFWRCRALNELAAQNPTGSLEDINRAVQLNPIDPVSRVILAEAYSDRGQTQDAMREYEESLRLEPDFPVALDALAQLLATGGKADRERAVQLAARACELTDYRQADRVATLAWAQIHAGMVDDATASFNLACDLAANTGKPGQVEGLAEDLNNAAWLLATSPDDAQRNGPDAIQLAQRACTLTRYQKTAFICTLAAAYAEAGKFDAAIATAQRACKLAEQNGEYDMLARNQQLLKLFQDHKPAREGN